MLPLRSTSCQSPQTQCGERALALALVSGILYLRLLHASPLSVTLIVGLSSAAGHVATVRSQEARCISRITTAVKPPDTSVPALASAAAPWEPLSFTFPDGEFHKDRNSIHSVHGSVPCGARHRASQLVYTQLMLAENHQQIRGILES